MRAVKAFLIIIVVAISSTFVYFFHEKSGPFYGDALGYYLYLPATFIYNNHTSIYEEPANVELPSSVTWYLDQQRREAVKTPKGYSLNQYTYGVALLESPFFLTAHLFEKITGRSATGYSSVYENAIKISSAVYAVLGLVIVFLLLRRFFSYSASLLAVLLLFIGSEVRISRTCTKDHYTSFFQMSYCSTTNIGFSDLLHFYRALQSCLHTYFL